MLCGKHLIYTIKEGTMVISNTSTTPKKIPSGIDSLDTMIDGGFPAGSLVLLLGELGAGDAEFVYTSAARLLSNGSAAPDKICYISFTKSREDVLNELALSFPEYYDTLRTCMEFKDFSGAYFARSSVPLSWTTGKEISLDSLKWNGDANLIETLIKYLDENARDSIVIIDSLTALAQYCLENLKWKDLVMFLRGLQRISKRWNGIVYAILGDGIIDRNKQEELAECADGVLVFEWGKLGATRRQRFMHIKKFRGVLPLLDQDSIVNFETQISVQKGFEVSNVKRVCGG